MRLTYISVLLVDWVFLRLMHSNGWGQPLWYSTLVGGSLLYVAQVDPGLRPAAARGERHLLRSLATGLICLTAMYQTEADLMLGLLTVGLGIGFVLAGLLLRVRAFLYLGTVTFIVQVLHLLWLFINDYSLLLWGLGIVLGLLLIWTAATFEARRNQVVALMQYWIAELQVWE